MCGRITLTTLPKELVTDLVQLPLPNFQPRYNIAPTQPVLCVRREAQETVATDLSWGLIPAWSKDLATAGRLFNARSETVATKPAFRAAFKSRRCVVLGDGFYEWKKQGSARLPFHIAPTQEALLLMAGLWEHWVDPADKSSSAIETCTILTTDANDLMSPLHDRMPVLLDEESLGAWLDPDFKDRTHLQSLLRPAPNDRLAMRPVSQYVNRVSNQGPACWDPPIEDPQKRLFD